jgi:hypothetical protein
MEHKDKKDKEFQELLKKDLEDGLLHIDFLHDNPSSRVKNKEFYDMIKEKKIQIYKGSKPEDLENFLHNEIINFQNNDSIFKSNMKYSNKKILYENLSSFVGILDKSVDNDEMKLKLNSIFGLKEFELTFIGNCEKFLNNSTVKLDNKFFLNGNLKDEYILEAIKIGFLPQSQNKLINYNSFYNSTDKILYQELVLLNKYIIESMPIIKKYKSTFFENYYEDLDKIKKCLNLIKTPEDINLYYKNISDKIDLIILSMKEARDIYYIKEINIMKEKNPNKKYLLVSGDMIQSYRGIINNISVINVSLSMIRFIALYEKKNLYMIGNPFELISSKKEIINLNSEFQKKIIKDILLNPVIKLKSNIKLNTKYFIKDYHKIYQSSYLKKLSELFVDITDDKEGLNGIEANSSTFLNLKEKKIEMDYLLNFAKNNINNYQELLFVFQTLREYNQNRIRAFDHLLNTLKSNQEELLKLNQEINESTYQYQIFYLTTIYEYFSLLQYLFPITKKFYPKKFDWNQIEILT